MSGDVEEIARIVKEPEPCPYLKDRMARMELRVMCHVDPAAWSALLAAGHRRFGMVVFRPVCEGCSACIPIRVPVARFRPSKSQRRVIRRNGDAVVEVGRPSVDEEKIELHRAFHADRTARVGWQPQAVDEERYSQVFLENTVATLELRYRILGRLAAVAYVDVGDDAVNSIYCFRHPDFRGRSLGTFDVLSQIRLADRLGKAYLYLGYYVAGCRSLRYKAAFRPGEALIDGVWREHDFRVSP